MRGVVRGDKGRMSEVVGGDRTSRVVKGGQDLRMSGVVRGIQDLRMSYTVLST